MPALTLRLSWRQSPNGGHWLINGYAHCERALHRQNLSTGLRTLFLVHFIGALIFGLLFLLIPATFFSWFGLSVPDVQPYRIAGAAVIAFGFSSWFCYQSAKWDEVKIVVQTEIIWADLATLVLLYGLLFAGSAAVWWINVVIFAGFTLAFVYYYSKK